MKFDEFLYGAYVVALEDRNINCVKTTSTPVRSEFNEHVITVWNELALGTDFRSLVHFKNSILATDFAAHLKSFLALISFYCSYICYFHFIHTLCPEKSKPLDNIE